MSKTQAKPIFLENILNYPKFQTYMQKYALTFRICNNDQKPSGTGNLAAQLTVPNLNNENIGFLPNDNKIIVGDYCCHSKPRILYEPQSMAGALHSQHPQNC
jgi:hypothetical protein